MLAVGEKSRDCRAWWPGVDNMGWEVPLFISERGLAQGSVLEAENRPCPCPSPSGQAARGPTSGHQCAHQWKSLKPRTRAQSQCRVPDSHQLQPPVCVRQASISCCLSARCGGTYSFACATRRWGSRGPPSLSAIGPQRGSEGSPRPPPRGLTRPSPPGPRT